METIGIAFELPFLSEEERVAATKLTKLYQGMQTDDIRNYLENVRQIVEPAGLHASNGGSHIWIVRSVDRDTEMAKPEAPYNVSGLSDEERAKYRREVDIRRWAIICDENVAKSWQRTADLKEVESHGTVNNSIQTDNDMNFFQQLAEMAQGLDLTIKVNEKNGTLTIEVLPGNVDTLRPVRLKGTPKDVDEGIIEAIRKPLELVKGLQVDTSDFEKSVNKGLDKSVAKNTLQKEQPKAAPKPAAKKPAPVKPGAPSTKKIIEKKAEATIPPPTTDLQPETKTEGEAAEGSTIVPDITIVAEEPKAEESPKQDPAPTVTEVPQVDNEPKKPVELSMF